MNMVEEGTPNPLGEQLVDELRWVHGILRDNLAIIRSIVDRINGGAPAQQIKDEIDDFAATGAVWTLRINCLRYCSLVHAHHSGEDTHFFPGLRRANPDLCPVIDKLEADYLAISHYLDDVEASAKLILQDESARVDLAGALNALADHLLTHLDYEETNLNPTLRRLTAWPHP
jgi:hemerythrin HHE cation binding domain-containing protein